MDKKRYSVILSELEDSIKWIESKGIDISRTRLSQLYDDIKNFVNQRLILPKSDINPDEFKAQVYSFIEVGDVTEIYRQFQNIESDVFDEKLQKSIRGPRSGTKETERSLIARNTMAELAWAAALSKSGFEVEFDPISDIVQEINQNQYRSIVWEVKRPDKKQNLDKLMKKGRKQLNKRFSDPCFRMDRKPLGGCIVVIIDKIFGIDDCYIKSGSEFSANNYLKRTIKSFYGENKKLFEPIWRNNILGLLMWWRLPGMIQNMLGMNILTEVNQTMFVMNKDYENLEKGNIIYRIYNSING